MQTVWQPRIYVRSSDAAGWILRKTGVICLSEERAWEQLEILKTSNWWNTDYAEDPDTIEGFSVHYGVSDCLLEWL